MDHGHPRAREYPIGMVWEEARIVMRRLEHDYATRALLMRAAVSASFNKDAARNFDEMIEGMTDV